MRSSRQHVAHSPELLLTEFPANCRYLIGVSGGRDSIALLHLLQTAGYTKLIICHLDHQLRGRAAKADAVFVQRVGQTVGFEVEVGTTNVRDLSKHSKVSIETAARIARFGFFVAMARRHRCRTLFLGHHADDLVETALLNFFRGASPGGIAAMRPVSIHRIGKTALTVVRPLLNVWRTEIDRYVRQHELSYREDVTNAELDATRNRIRLRVLPYIDKQFGRNVRRSIWRAAEIWSEEETLLDSMIDSATFAGRELNVSMVRELPVALQRRAILHWLRKHNVPNIGFNLVENVRGLVQPAATAAKVNLPGAHHVRRRAGKIFIQRRAGD
jgi:tRNA(Ile)-lysidine synthase